MAGGSNDHSSSVFHVGDNVELARVVGMVSILVVFIMIFERLIHALGHYLLKYPKYHEMMTKVFAELMILGLIGLGIKILKELDQLDPYSKSMIAFQAADIMVFFMAIVLIIQAIVVFLRVRRKNIQVAKAELISTQHLADFIARSNLPSWFHDFRAIFTYSHKPDLRKLTSADIPEVTRIRILRHYFLQRYRLPQLFPFSKYLRQAQDNQISSMIEVEISTWMILLLIAWLLEVVSEVVKHRWTEKYAIVIALVMFSWASVLVHMAITAYYSYAIGKLLDAAVDVNENSESVQTDPYQYLDDVAEQENIARGREVASEAIATMQDVRERERRKRVKHKRNILNEHDTGFQLVSTVIRQASSKKRMRAEEDAIDKAVAAEEEGAALDTATATNLKRIHLRWFSRKAWHFVIMSTLMLNALYVALFLQCVVYLMKDIYHEIGGGLIIFIPLPLVINVVAFQPRILRNFILVSSIVRVDDTALGDVIDHFTETIQLRAGFADTVHSHLESTNQTTVDIQKEFEFLDEEKSGLLDVEDVRLVLTHFGFTLSFFRFNSVAKLLFDLNGMQIEYAQVIKLLDVGNNEEIRSLASTTVLLIGGMVDCTNASSTFVVQGPSPYVLETPIAGAESKPKSNRVLLRARSSVASSLYNFDFDETNARFEGDVSSPTQEYIRM